MDLKEQTFENYNRRNPWERKRLNFFSKLSQRYISNPSTVLDVGAGDCWFGFNFSMQMRANNITFVDSSFTEERKENILSALPKKPEMEFASEPPHTTYDVVLLLDVLEHVRDDKALLKEIVRKNLKENSLLVLSVPALQFLYGQHDRELDHYRRYSGSQARALVESVGLTMLECGYLFPTLVPMRLLDNFFSQLVSKSKHPRRYRVSSEHLILDPILEAALTLDMKVQELAGFRLPGLTWWSICKKEALHG